MYYIDGALYKKIYFQLFNAVTDALELLEKEEVSAAKELLIKAQQDCEEIYISGRD